VPLLELVQRELAPFTAPHVVFDGPDVVLKAESTQAVAIVLHELTTNAAKFGAFSSRAGRVALRWGWRANGSGCRLAIDWQETGGPAPTRPHRTGYGMRVVRELIPFELGGLVNLTFAPAGLLCQLEIPADWVASASSRDGKASAAGRRL